MSSLMILGAGAPKSSLRNDPVCSVYRKGLQLEVCNYSDFVSGRKMKDLKDLYIYISRA